MNNIKFKTFAVAFSMLSLINFSACDKEDDVVDNGDRSSGRSSKKDYTIHKYIFDTFGTYYYWNTNVPSYYRVEDYDTPYDVLESFREQTDRFSAVLNNYTEATKSLENDYKTDGINYMLYRAESGTNKIVAVVNYVYDNSPAKQAGVKRGFVITAVNGEYLTDDNYSTLLSLDVCTYSYKTISAVDSGEGAPKLEWKNSEEKTTEQITKVDLKVDPVLQIKTFNKNDKRIGYFLYDSFTSDTKTIMNAVEKLQAQQVTDLVLDLRLNGGGYGSTLDTLASMLVPSGNVGNIFVKTEYNTLLSTYFLRNNPNYNKTFFVDISPKLELSTLYVLISSNTASASEELISGLSPYMKVVLIGGENSYGKFTSNLLLNDDEDRGSDENGIPYSEWAAYVSIGCCKNSLNEMKFAEGFAPDYTVKDIFYELGDENEPLLNTAISLIEGNVLSKKSKTLDLDLNDKIGAFGKPEITRSAMIQSINIKKY